jgi:RNA polymerase sigma-70 factor (ECF subfamily)
VSLDIEALYVAHHGPLKGFIAKRMPDAAPGDIEDLAADVFERAVRAAPRYQDRGLPPSAWLYQIARNLMTDYFRHHAVIQVGYLDEARPPYIEKLGTDVHLERLDTRDAISATFTGGWNRPTPKQRAAIEAYYFEGYMDAEVGQRLGLSEMAAKKLRGRALANLRKRLEAA